MEWKKVLLKFFFRVKPLKKYHSQKTFGDLRKVLGNHLLLSNTPKMCTESWYTKFENFRLI